MSAPKTKYIVRAIASGGFWTGLSWSDEYPDAEIYSAVTKARNAAAFAAQKSQSGVEVIADYGYSNERVVCEVRQ